MYNDIVTCHIHKNMQEYVLFDTLQLRVTYQRKYLQRLIKLHDNLNSADKCCYINDAASKLFFDKGFCG